MARRLEVKSVLETSVTVGKPDEITRLGTIKLEAGLPTTIAGGEIADEAAPGS